VWIFVCLIVEEDGNPIPEKARLALFLANASHSQRKSALRAV